MFAAYPFANLANLYDIGGGDGQFMVTMLSACAETRGLLLDLPHVAIKARARLQEAGLTGCCEVVGGDIFKSIPSGGAAYLLARVHDWADEDARKILAVCRRAMGPGSVLLMVERVMPEQIDAQPASRALAVSDLNMLVMTGGRERTRAQYEALLHSAGFTMTSITATGTALSVLEARIDT